MPLQAVHHSCLALVLHPIHAQACSRTRGLNASFSCIGCYQSVYAHAPSACAAATTASTAVLLCEDRPAQTGHKQGLPVSSAPMAMSSGVAMLFRAGQNAALMGRAAGGTPDWHSNSMAPSATFTLHILADGVALVEAA